MPLHLPPAPAPALRSVLTVLGTPSAVKGSRVPVALRASGRLRPEIPLPAYELARVAPSPGERSGECTGERAGERPSVERPSVHVVEGSAHGAEPSAPCAPLGPLDASSPRTRLTGWRFLLADDGADGDSSQDAAAAQAPAYIGTAEAVPAADGWVFGQFGQGPYVLSTVRAIHQAELLPAPYQPRLLSVPELYMLTLWLHADVTADPSSGVPAPADLLIPLAPAPLGIAPHTTHRVDALLPVLTSRLAASPAAAVINAAGPQPAPQPAPLLRTSA